MAPNSVVRADPDPQALAERIIAVCGNEGMQARAKEVATEVRGWRGVAAAADLVLAACSPWPKLRAAELL